MKRGISNTQLRQVRILDLEEALETLKEADPMEHNLLKELGAIQNAIDYLKSLK